MSQVDQCVNAARNALNTWANTPLEERCEKIQAVAAGYARRKSELAETISRQTGKPRWESSQEVEAMINKAAISIAAQKDRRPDTPAIHFRPIGVLAVIGPFNMPGHLPNGHLMPAVLAGNTVVFKPSELTPLVGDFMAEIWGEAGFPAGVFNLVHGGAETGAALAAHADVDGILFTGSRAAGGAIHRACAGEPQKLLALEMGGNNPLIVWDCADLAAAVWCIIQSAFITAGRRCTCARRLIVPRGSPLLAVLMEWMKRLRVGLYTDEPQPFMGPVISAGASEKLLRAQAELGGRILIEMKRDPRSPALLHPGLIDMTGIAANDQEIFGPLLQLIYVDDFDAAIAEANRTRYGLAAGLISDNRNLYEKFRRLIRAGVLAFNRPTTGASSALPFGGIGDSGNHRPSAIFAADYCSDPVAAVEMERVSLPEKLPPGMMRP